MKYCRYVEGCFNCVKEHVIYIYGIYIHIQSLEICHYYLKFFYRRQVLASVETRAKNPKAQKGCRKLG